jgi:4-amino-4-deoxy-L-arabinose transferase-like glycosyltransferase
MAAVVAEVARTRGRVIARVPAVWPLVLLVGVGAVVRFAGLGAQSLWLDEWLTHNYTVMSFHDMARSVLHTEAHPPLYFGGVWLWTKVFGTGEAGLRSFSAVAGTISIPLAYAAARSRFPGRVALLAAALVAVNPFSVWFSQEARPYALLEALCLASLVCTIRVVDGGGRRWLWGWVATASLALLTHFFAAFLLVGEAVWLLRRGRERERLLAVGAVGVFGLALLALVAHGRTSEVAWVHASAPLGTRVRLLPVQFLTGLYLNWDSAMDTAVRFVIAAAVVGAGLVLVAVARDTRRAAAPFALVGATMIALPIALAVVRPSSDYVLPRYLIAAVAPLLIVVAAGLAAGRFRRLGIAAGAGLVAIFLSMTISIATRDELQRPDWRAVAGALGKARSDRVVVTDLNVQARPLTLYAPGLRPVYDAGSAVWAGDAAAKGRAPVRASEIDYITPVVLSANAGRVPPAPGLRLTARRSTAGFLILTYTSPKPVATTAGEVARGSSRVYGLSLSGPLAASVYVQSRGG